MTERRSTRKRKLNAKYYDNNNALEDDGFIPELEAVGDAEDDDDYDSVVASDDEEASVGAGNPDDEDVSDNGIASSSKRSGPLGYSVEKPNAKIIKGVSALSEGNLRDRGVRRVGRESSKDATMIYTFGSQPEDIEPFVKARHKWYGELTIPSRVANAEGEGGMGYSFYQADAQREAERTTGWDWYYEQGGRAAFEHRQVVKLLEREDAKPYLRDATCRFVGGAPSQQRIFTLDAQQALNIGEVWSNATSETDDHGRGGWLINNGESADNLDWAPNQPDGAQYLAIGGSSKTPRGAGTAAFKAKSTPAFTRTPPLAASIQIWEFASVASPGATITPDPRTAPSLRAVLCMDWGPIRQLQWAPFLRSEPRRRAPDETPPLQLQLHLGLLAILCGDGAVRVLDVHLPRSSSCYMHITTAAFTSTPPDTLFTCLTWNNPQVLTLGCANGYLTSINLTAHLLSPSPPPHARPALHLALHSTYILSITACLPSRPHLILTSSLDGHVRLTSLLAPTTDSTATQRARIGHPGLIWLDAIQHVLAADDAALLHVYNARRMHTSVVAARMPAGVAVLAASRVHAAVLVGLAGGEVGVINPLRKALHGRGRRKGAGLERQVWLRGEWRRGDEDEGLSRLTTGYAVQEPGLSAARRAPTGEVTGVSTTIYEERSAVRSVAWNPNLAAGGWAAAGLGSGVVWVEDIAWDGDGDGGSG